MTMPDDDVRETIEEALIAWMADSLMDNYNGYANSAEVDERRAKVDAVHAWLNEQEAERKEAAK